MAQLAEITRICIYPGFNAFYYSFYLHGLISAFRTKPIVFRRRHFPVFGHHCLALRLEGPRTRNIYISASDGRGVNPKGLDWCHVYGKVNVSTDHQPAAADRLLAIGPSFAVRLWPWWQAAALAMINYLRCQGRVELPREHFANYWRQYRYRLPESLYRPREGDPSYVFFAASLWKAEPETNRLRANFIRACRSFDAVDFEGGFAPRTRGDVPGFEGLTFERRYPFAQYLERTRRSAVVFNTPTVASCHGWKLGEFLALGKAIISTPLANRMPAPVEHRKHLHLVDGSVESIRDAIEEIRDDPKYRASLERNARGYYTQHLAPERVVRRLVHSVGLAI